jgi:hypothetical protein
MRDFNFSTRLVSIANSTPTKHGHESGQFLATSNKPNELAASPYPQNTVMNSETSNSNTPKTGERKCQDKEEGGGKRHIICIECKTMKKKPSTTARAIYKA